VPTGLGDHGVPTGIQLVARAYDDQRVFRLGAALEAAQNPLTHNWLGEPSRRPAL
jgi:Asp-tRNA(Asn)/Glu-tRNA(Gln) amidotransferase A subunit family amidase